MKKWHLTIVTMVTIIILASACQKQTDKFNWKPMDNAKKGTGPIVSHYSHKLWLNKNIIGATETISGKNDGITYKANESFDFVIAGDKAYFNSFHKDDVDGDIPIEKWFYSKDLSDKPIKK